MSLTFLQAKNNSLVCKNNDVYLHSSYNPELEAQRFVESIEVPFIPSIIFILEPCMSYCLKPLRQSFPKSKLCAIRFINDFTKYDDGWDYVIQYNGNKEVLNSSLSYFGEDMLLSSFFITWPESSKVFCENNIEVWDLIKENIEKSKTVLVTRQYFQKRWMKNSVKYFSSISRYSLIKRIEKPILIIASGPSLKTSILEIKKRRDRFFIISVSSALCSLKSNNITPDLCIATDGGYWANKHLEYLSKEVPLAITSEASCPASIFKDNIIIPLCYEDKMQKQFFSKCNMEYILAARNGTVSGTALELALSLTTENIYICGLDLACAKGFQHTQPESLELDNSKKDYRLRTVLSRLVPREYSSYSLKIYENWFRSLDEKIAKRVYRVSNNYVFRNSLNHIKDISWNDFNTSEKNDSTQNSFFTDSKNIDYRKNLSKIRDFILEKSNTDEWIDTIFPADCILKKRSNNDGEKYESAQKDKNKAYVKDLILYLDKKNDL